MTDAAGLDFDLYLLRSHLARIEFEFGKFAAFFFRSPAVEFVAHGKNLGRDAARATCNCLVLNNPWKRAQAKLMSNDSFTETSSTGWFSRIGDSIKGILFGIVLILVSAVLMFWNEGRAVKTRKTLDEGAKTVVSIPADTLDSSKDGSLVYMTGPATAASPLSDSALDVTVPALKLRRSVEMYQWKEETKSETKKKLGGGEETTTTYSYAKDWSDKAINSANFNEKGRAGHENPPMPIKEQDWTASPITVGAYTLSSGLSGQINNFTPVQVDAEAVVPEMIGSKKVHVEGDGYYLGEDPSSPVIGDARVSHEAALPGDVSLIAKLRGSTFEPFTAKAGGNIQMLETGNHSPESMFESAQAGNRMMTWILRVVGVVLMFFGFSMLFRPLSVLADVLPLAGTIVGAGTSLVALLLTIPISLVIIAVAWIFYRPLVGIPLLIAAVVGIVFLIKKIMDQKRKPATA